MMLVGVPARFGANMKAEDCKLGVRVRWYGDGDFIVKSEPDLNEKVAIIDGHHIHRANLDDLHLIDEELDKACAARAQALLDKAKVSFEEAFKAYKEANDISHENGMGLYQMEEAGLISTDDLEDVVEQGGWSMSSLVCSLA